MFGIDLSFFSFTLHLNTTTSTMSYHFFFSGKEKSNLQADFYPPIVLDDQGLYEIGLTNFSASNAIPNVDKSNNLFHYGLDKKIEIPTGSYEITDISSYLMDALASDKKKVDEVNFELKANLNTLKCHIKCNKPIDFSKEHSIGKLLGFKKRILEANKEHISDFPVDIMRINLIRIECNLVMNSYRNGDSVHTLYSFYPQQPPGYKIVESPTNVIYLPINTSNINNIRLHIVDQNSRPVNFRQEVISITLHLRKYGG